jgi:hypothetical protein
MAFLATVISFLLPVTSFAQNTRGAANSVDNLGIADIPNDSIVVLSQADTDIPGYVHETYVYVNQNCVGGFQLVDHYGSPIDPKDPHLRSSELAQCLDSRYRALEDGGD